DAWGAALAIPNPYPSPNPNAEHVGFDPLPRGWGWGKGPIVVMHPMLTQFPLPMEWHGGIMHGDLVVFLAHRVLGEQVHFRATCCFLNLTLFFSPLSSVVIGSCFP
ncbi:unnamed protein product, partial [Discosporangium mesarthrocarpum]